MQKLSNNLVVTFSFIIVVLLLLFAIFRDSSELVSLDKATQLLESKKVQTVVQSSSYIYLKTEKKLYKIAASKISPQLLKEYKVELENKKPLYIFFGLILLVGIGSVLFRFYQKQQLFKVNHSKQQQKNEDFTQDSTPITPIKSDVKFEDIGGINDVKVELEEIIDFLKNPKRYKDFGVHMPRGVLLVGPPGVGKTMIAKAVANEADVSFYYQSGASFVQIYVGMGAKRVHELFMAARNNAPAIIFIDEIDAIGKKRDGQRNDEREATLNQLLTEMDGFENSSGIIVIAATNNIDVLDSALLRAGRFDRRVFVELPTNKEREAILEKYLKNVPHSVDTKALANISVGFNGAALAAFVNEAALLCLREGRDIVVQDDFEKVKDKVIFGKKKLQLLNKEHKEFQVVYQAAKVTLATYFDLPFEKMMLTSQHLTPPTDEPLLQSELEGRVCVLLAGMVACDTRFLEHTSSVKNDLEEVKELLQKMLNDYGMGERLFVQKEDEEKLFIQLTQKTKELLKSLQNSIEKVEKILVEKESITKEEVQEILG